MASYPADRHGIILPLKICVGVTSALSIVGGFLIVLTFCLRLCAKRGRYNAAPGDGGTNGAGAAAGRERALEMMSPGRLIIVNLSIADILLAASHLWGVLAGYQQFFNKNDNAHNSGPNGSTDTMCDVQGALAVYGTISSFLWTIILSFFVVGTLLLPHPRRYGSLCAFLVYQLICWGLPAVVLFVIALEKEFGSQDDVTIGLSIIYAV